MRLHAKTAVVTGAASGIGKAYEPVHACLKCDRSIWRPGETWRAELWAVSDRFEDLPACEVAWSIQDAEGRQTARGTKQVAILANPSAKIGDVTWPIPKDYDSFFIVYCTIKDLSSGTMLSENEYVHSGRQSSRYPLAVLWDAPRTELKLEMVQESSNTAIATITNGGTRNALVCTLDLPLTMHAVALYSDNGFCLPPGGVRKVAVRATDPSDPAWQPDFGGLSVKAWNSLTTTEKGTSR